MDSLASSLDKFLEDLKTVKGKEGHRCRFRGSALPYCQVDDFLTRLHGDDPPTVEFYRNREFFFEVGTAVHGLVQRWLSESKGTVRFFGNWVCADCFKVRDGCFSPQMCCDDFMTYRELEFGIPNSGFSGHSDGVLILNLGDQCCLLEIKTCGEDIPGDTPSHPIPLEYRWQVSAYSYILREQYGLDLDTRVAFLFVPRKNFKDATFRLYEPEFIEAFKKSVKEEQEVAGLLESGDISALRPLCANAKEGEGCPYVGICFSPIRDKMIREVWTNARS